MQNKKKKTMCCMTICPCCRKCFDTLRFEANLFFPLFWTKTPILKPNICLSFFAFSFFVFSNYHNGSFRPLQANPSRRRRLFTANKRFRCGVTRVKKLHFLRVPCRKARVRVLRASPFVAAMSDMKRRASRQSVLKSSGLACPNNWGERLWVR